AARGYVAEARTLVQVADAGEVAGRLADAAPADPALEVTLADAPDVAWLDAWWSVDGRGGSAELAVARRILEGGPAVYAAVRDGDRVL
ncbi:GNAT family N-acetyltransferase, partial [Clavibacter michiganensis]